MSEYLNMGFTNGLVFTTDYSNLWASLVAFENAKPPVNEPSDGKINFSPDDILNFIPCVFEPTEEENLVLYQTLVEGKQDWLDATAECCPSWIFEYNGSSIGICSCKIVINNADGRCRKMSDEEWNGINDIFLKYTHANTQEEQRVDEPISGFCGNTVTTVYLRSEETGVSFMYDDSVILTELLVNLDYKPENLCKCIMENYYTVDTEFGKGYQINLDGAFVRCDKGQANLTEKQVAIIKEIIERVV